ncbi:MAG: RIO1 family regulatory kinase/ATPase [Ktedonobacterales bacterium]
MELTPKEAQPLFERILRNIELWLACDRIHGDLSEYNILYWQGAAIIIDFAQALDPRHGLGYGADMYALLARDIARVCRYFARYGVEANAEEIAHTLWNRYEAGELT